ncbi:MAG: hypothetical protein LW817_02100 [Candidatus Caenarcaniphilales bacterium]|nr:hypothetical protein [Candidatus Caenarcaniphilales bacterium]
MQQQINKDFKLNPAALGFKANNNGLIGKGPNTSTKAPKSFANELLKTSQELHDREEISFEQEEITNEAFAENQNPKAHKTIKTTSSFGAAIQKEIIDQQEKDHLKDHQENIKEAFKSEENYESMQDAYQSQEKYQQDENVKAAASQEGHKQITNAVREGNVAPQEARQDNGNDRKKQLANWEDMAPKIMEDPTNKAIRIDIPGLVDIETLIVRMKNGQVSVQAVGEKDTMAKLQASENLLGNKLREKNIQLASLQAFDAGLVKR